MKILRKLAYLRFLWASALLVLAVTGCIFSSSDGTLSGDVTDKSNGEAIAGAMVEVKFLTNGETNAGESEEDGYYRVTGLKKGNYKVIVKKDGYKDKEIDFEYKDEGFACLPTVETLDIQLEKKPEKGSIIGKVTDESGNGVAEVRMYIEQENYTNDKYTDADGKYVFTEIRAGEYKITAKKSNYASTVKTVKVSGGDTSECNISTVYMPTGIYNHAAVWDPQNDRMLIYGGNDGSRSDYGTADYVWSFNGTKWFKLIPDIYFGVVDGHSIVWDPVMSRILIFGGYNEDLSKYPNELYCYDGTSFLEINVGDTTPLGRSGHTAVWDSLNNRMLVFGGYKDSYLNDLWSYDGATWQELSPAGTLPSVRNSHVAVWDNVNNRMLIFGGRGAGGSMLGDVWSFDGTSWTQINVSGSVPPPRQNHTAVWDSLNNRMLVFGGYNQATDEFYNDLWSFDGANWTKIIPAGDAPIPVASHTAVWDSLNKRMLVYGGGNDNDGFADALWSFNGTSWTKLMP